MYIVRLKYFFLFVFWLSIYQIKIFIYCTCQSYIVSYFFSWHSFFFFLLFLYRFTFYRAWCCQRCWRSTSSVSGVECHRAVFERVRLFLICSLWFPVLVFFFWWVTHFFILLLLPTPSSFFSTISLLLLYHHQLLQLQDGCCSKETSSNICQLRTCTSKNSCISFWS